MEMFITSSEEQNDEYWSNFEIVNNEPIYDASLNQYGYVFELKKSNIDGYGIIVKNSQNEYVFAEGSYSSESPYKTYNDEYKNVYTNALDYYVTKETKTKSNTFNLIDVFSGKSFSNDELINDRFDYQPSVQTKAIPGEVTTYLPNYSSKFVKGTQQPNSVACIPTSIAMSLLYLHNTGKITIDSGYRTIAKMRDTMFPDMYDANLGMCSSANAVKGLHNFSINHCNKRVETRGDEFQPNTYLETAKEEVDTGYPPVLVYRANTMYSVSHACTMVGYKTVNNSSTGGQTLTSAVIVVDPAPTTPRVVTTAWSSSQIWGYFIMYVY